jgi:hypothetical protein
MPKPHLIDVNNEEQVHEFVRQKFLTIGIDIDDPNDEGAILSRIQADLAILARYNRQQMSLRTRKNVEEEAKLSKLSADLAANRTRHELQRKSLGESDDDDTELSRIQADLAILARYNRQQMSLRTRKTVEEEAKLSRLSTDLAANRTRHELQRTDTDDSSGESDDDDTELSIIRDDLAILARYNLQQMSLRTRTNVDDNPELSKLKAILAADLARYNRQ